MAIKTKKITDLGTINISSNGAGSLTDSDFFLIGCKSGITGKVETKSLVNAITQYASNIVATAIEAMASSDDDNNEEVNKIKSDVLALNNSVNDLSQLINTIASTPATVASECDCKEKIATLEAKVTALEGFVKALQADGYLTLANIKKAAAEAYPVEESAE